jgi:polyisoprenyl-teichoic acid--peptidoglycan teichoic acid transferase
MTKPKRWITLFVLIMLSSGCSAIRPATNDGVSNGSTLASSPALPSETPTPTPFQPATTSNAPLASPTPIVTAEPTIEPTPANPWGDFEGPTSLSAIEIPSPMAEFDFPKGTVNILLLGSDQRAYESIGRSDTIIIVSLNKQDKTATLISVPRDLYVYIPGRRVDRVNTAFVFGGNTMITETIHYNFGIPIDFVVHMDFEGFVTAIDLLGGLDVEITDYLNDECGGVYRSYAPGTDHMGGFEALCYVRMRKASSDFDRLRRQQEVIQAIFDRVLSVDGLTSIPKLYRQFDEYVQTSMGLDDVLTLAPLALQLASGDAEIGTVRIDRSVVTSWTVPSSGAAVLLPDYPGIQLKLEEAFGFSP